MQQAGPINSAAHISQIHGQSEREGSSLCVVICACANVTFSVVRAMNLVRFGFSVAATSASSRPTVYTSLNARAGTSDVATGPTLPPAKRRRLNIACKGGREWLNYDMNGGVIFCNWCRAFSRSDARNQFITGSSSMKLESIKKHEQSKFHKDAAGAHHAQLRPDNAPMERALHSMEREELEQMKRLFTTAFYLVRERGRQP